MELLLLSPPEVLRQWRIYPVPTKPVHEEGQSLLQTVRSYVKEDGVPTTRPLFLSALDLSRV